MLAPALRLPRHRAARAALALLALLLVALATQPWWVAPLVARDLSAASGRSVRFGAIWLGLNGALQPVVHFRGVEIENAAWADTSRPFVSAASAAAIVSWRSVAQRRPVVELLVLHDGSIDLERQADGRRNWRLRDAENRGAGRYKIMALEAHRSSIRFVHEGADLLLDASSSPAEPGAAPALPARIELRGAWRGLPFAARVATGPVLSFLETGRTFRLQGELEAGGARLVADGRAGDIFRRPLIEADVAVTGERVAALRAFFGGRGDDARPKAYRLEGRLTAADDAYDLRQATVRIGSTDLAGDIGLTRAQPRSSVRAVVRSASTELDDLLWLAGTRGPPRADDLPASPAARAVARAASGATTRAVQPGSRAASEAAAGADPSMPPGPPVAFAGARRIDADLRFEARRFHADEWPLLQSLQARAVLADGLLTLPAFDIGLAGGHASGDFAFDMRQRPAAASGELALRGLRLESLLRPKDAKHRVSGVLRGQARLTARGATGEALLASATGTASARLEGGHISSLLDAQLGLQGGKVLRGLLTGPEQIGIRCATAVLEMQKGAGRLHSLVLDTERTRTRGRGAFDLGRRTIDLTLTPEAKTDGLFVLDRSIRLQGPIGALDKRLIDRVDIGAGPGCAA